MIEIYVAKSKLADALDIIDGCAVAYTMHQASPLLWCFDVEYPDDADDDYDELINDIIEAIASL